MKKYLNYLGIIFLAVLMGCGNAVEESIEDKSNSFALMDIETEAAVEEDMAEPEETNDKTARVATRKLIKEGVLAFETKSIEETRKVILDAALKYNAYIADDELDESSTRISNYIEVRIPSTYFDKFIEAISVGVEKFDVKDISVKDVTEEYLDIAARLKTKKELEDRYHALLKKANTVNEILEIERAIAKLRGEIESIEGRLRYLQDRISMSSLEIRFYESKPEVGVFDGEFANGFKNGWQNLVWFVIGITHIWPFVLLIIVAFILFRRYRRKRRKTN